jgi:hypothetical protein
MSNKIAKKPDIILENVIIPYDDSEFLYEPSADELNEKINIGELNKYEYEINEYKTHGIQKSELPVEKPQNLNHIKLPYTEEQFINNKHIKNYVPKYNESKLTENNNIIEIYKFKNIKKSSIYAEKPNDPKKEVPIDEKDLLLIENLEEINKKLVELSKFPEYNYFEGLSESQLYIEKSKYSQSTKIETTDKYFKETLTDDIIRQKIKLLSDTYIKDLKHIEEKYVRDISEHKIDWDETEIRKKYEIIKNKIDNVDEWKFYKKIKNDISFTKLTKDKIYYENKIMECDSHPFNPNCEACKKQSWAIEKIKYNKSLNIIKNHLKTISGNLCEEKYLNLSEKYSDEVYWQNKENLFDEYILCGNVEDIKHKYEISEYVKQHKEGWNETKKLIELGKQGIKRRYFEKLLKWRENMRSEIVELLICKKRIEFIKLHETDLREKIKYNIDIGKYESYHYYLLEKENIEIKKELDFIEKNKIAENIEKYLPDYENEKKLCRYEKYNFYIISKRYEHLKLISKIQDVEKYRKYYESKKYESYNYFQLNEKLLKINEIIDLFEKCEYIDEMNDEHNLRLYESYDYFITQNEYDKYKNIANLISDIEKAEKAEKAYPLLNLNKYYEEFHKLDKELIIALNTYKQYEKIKDKYDKCVSRKNFIENRYKIIGDISEIFTNYRKDMYIAKIIPKLCEFVNEIVSGITFDDTNNDVKYEDKYTLSGNYNESGTITWKITSKFHEDVHISRIGGFRKFLYNLAIHIAFLKIKLGGIYIPQLFIDEGFNSCDSNNIKKMGTFLERLIKNYGYENVILVSHTKYLKELFGTEILIEKKNINGNVYSVLN